MMRTFMHCEDTPSRCRVPLPCATQTIPANGVKRAMRESLFALAHVDAPRGARLVYDDLAQLRQRGLKALPDPPRQVLAGGVLQPLDFIEVIVVQTVQQRLECRLDLTEVHDPP